MHCGGGQHRVIRTLSNWHEMPAQCIKIVDTSIPVHFFFSKQIRVRFTGVWRDSRTWITCTCTYIPAFQTVYRSSSQRHDQLCLCTGASRLRGFPTRSSSPSPFAHSIGIPVLLSGYRVQLPDGDSPLSYTLVKVLHRYRLLRDIRNLENTMRFPTHCNHMQSTELHKR